MARQALDGTRQRGTVTVECTTTGDVITSSDFVTVVLKGGDVLQEELREVVFKGSARATQVLVKPPTSKTASGRPSARTRVISRTPGADGRLGSFRFDTLLPLPQTLLVEGATVSPTANDTSYDVEFHDAAGTLLARGTLAGTVVKVTAALTADGTRAFGRDRKLLALASGDATAEVTPDLAPGIEWTFPAGAGTVATPTALTTSFAATAAFTPASEAPPELTLTLTYAGGQIVEAFTPLRITAPRRLRLARNSSRGFVETTDLVRADRGFSLFERQIRYVLLDQYGDPIAETVYGGAVPTIQENIDRVLMTAIPALQRYITDTLQSQRTWRDTPQGEFADTLEASDIPAGVVSGNQGGRFTFDAELLRTVDGAPAGVLMETRPRNHVWSLSVNGDDTLAVDATDNPFRVVVSRIRDSGNIAFTSRYEVVLP